MDRRFVEVWTRLEARRDAGEKFDRILRGESAENLIAALAGTSGRDPVAANAIATALLNRFRRLRSLGPLMGALGAAIAVFALDILSEELYGGVFLGHPPNPILLVLTFAALTVAVLSFARLAGAWFAFLGRANRVFRRRGPKGAK